LDSQRFGTVRTKISVLWLKYLMLLLSLVMLLPLGLLFQTVRGAATMSYIIHPDNLVIRYGSQHSILLSDIRAVGELHLTGLSRIAGTSAPGLYEGNWRSQETGPIKLYATHLDSVVVIITEGTTYGITPADPAAFIAALEKHQVGTFAPATPKGNPVVALLPMILLVLVLIPGLWIMMGYIWRFPERLTYELGDSALVIETGWRPVRVPYGEIETVEETTLTGWPMRLVGTSLAGLHWGSFSWSAVPGKRINLYATQLKPLVLIRAGKRSLGLSPADGDGFVSALRERIGLK
jgi:hypothetical protein